MRIAIVGTGISGLTAAHVLHPRHELTLFEANTHVGGHTHTVDVEWQGERHAIDTGFIVYNDRTYPNFSRLLDELRIASCPTEMSFSVCCERRGLEYSGGTLGGLFAQRRNLVRPSFYRMLREILRFNRQAPAVLGGNHQSQTVGDFLIAHDYAHEFFADYLLPMGSAIWSCPRERFTDFPIQFVVEFFHNHGLLSLAGRPQWRVVCGGSRTYVEAMTEPFRDRIRLRTPVARVRRGDDHVSVVAAGGLEEHFEHVIFACHADQALKLLADPSPVERTLLRAFPYERNTAVLHTDVSVLPASRRAWAAWNYRLQRSAPDRATVTYNMNRLQRLPSPHTYCVTLNDDGRIDTTRVLGQFDYEHPVFTMARRTAQSRHGELLSTNRSSFCGAYWGNGFHEDGVNSALAVCRALEPSEAPCTAPSTSDGSAIADSRRSATSSRTGCS